MPSIRDNEDKLIRSNLGLVIKIAKGFNPRDINELDEYIQIGTIGLLKAIRKYNPNKGKLSTIAWPYIYYGILKVIQTQIKYNEALPMETFFNNSAVVVTPTSLKTLLPNSLTSLEKQIIHMRLEYKHTFKEIGSQLGGYTRGWANKKYKTAIQKIRRVYKYE